MMDKSKAVQFDHIPYGIDIDSVIEFLQGAQKIEWNIYCVFNGHKLYSADITVDGAYKTCVGMTKDEFDALGKELEAERAKEMAEAQENLSYWKEEGRKYIPQNLWNAWDKHVDSTVEYFQGGPLPELLKLLSLIDEEKVQTKQEVYDMIDPKGYPNMIIYDLKFFSDKFNKLPNDIENS